LAAKSDRIIRTAVVWMNDRVIRPGGWLLGDWRAIFPTN